MPPVRPMRRRLPMRKRGRRARAGNACEASRRDSSKRHELEADLNTRLAAAEAQIGETKAKAMSSVGAIAREAAAEIVQHLTGRPADVNAIARRKQKPGVSRELGRRTFRCDGVSVVRRSRDLFRPAQQDQRNARRARRRDQGGARRGGAPARRSRGAAAIIRAKESRCASRRGKHCRASAREAELIAKEAHQRMAEFVERRKQQAEQKIAMAEQQATADVRAAAADAAVRAAAIVLKDETEGRSRRPVGPRRHFRAEGARALIAISRRAIRVLWKSRQRASLSRAVVRSSRSSLLIRARRRHRNSLSREERWQARR